MKKYVITTILLLLLSFFISCDKSTKRSTKTALIDSTEYCGLRPALLKATKLFIDETIRIYGPDLNEKYPNKDKRLYAIYLTPDYTNDSCCLVSIQEHYSIYTKDQGYFVVEGDNISHKYKDNFDAGYYTYIDKHLVVIPMGKEDIEKWEPGFKSLVNFEQLKQITDSIPGYRVNMEMGPFDPFKMEFRIINSDSLKLINTTRYR